jgi:dihydropteroate synthase
VKEIKMLSRPAFQHELQLYFRSMPKLISDIVELIILTNKKKRIAHNILKSKQLLETNPEQALNGTTTLNTIALLKGASILRVHDVREAVECVKIVGAMGCGKTTVSK